MFMCWVFTVLGHWNIPFIILMIQGLLLLSFYICLWKLTKVHVNGANKPNLLSYHAHLVSVRCRKGQLVLPCLTDCSHRLLCLFFFFFAFSLPRSKLNDMIDGIPKSKKNKRCQLHSLDTHKPKPMGWVVRPLFYGFVSLTRLSVHSCNGFRMTGEWHSGQALPRDVVVKPPAFF